MNKEIIAMFGVGAAVLVAILTRFWSFGPAIKLPNADDYRLAPVGRLE